MESGDLQRGTRTNDELWRLHFASEHGVSRVGSHPRQSPLHNPMTVDRHPLPLLRNRMPRTVRSRSADSHRLAQVLTGHGLVSSVKAGIPWSPGGGAAGRHRHAAGGGIALDQPPGAGVTSSHVRRSSRGQRHAAIGQMDATACRAGPPTAVRSRTALGAAGERTGPPAASSTGRTGDGDAQHRPHGITGSCCRDRRPLAIVEARRQQLLRLPSRSPAGTPGMPGRPKTGRAGRAWRWRGASDRGTGTAVAWDAQGSETVSTAFRESWQRVVRVWPLGCGAGLDRGPCTSNGTAGFGPTGRVGTLGDSCQLLLAHCHIICSRPSRFGVR